MFGGTAEFQHEESVSIARDRVLGNNAVHHYPRLEEHPRRRGFGTCHLREGHREQLAVRIEIEQLLAILAPEGLAATIVRDLTYVIHFGESGDIDVRTAGLVGVV